MYKKIFLGIMILLFLSLTVSYSQYKKKTISQMLPAAENWHADRFLDNHVEWTATDLTDTDTILFNVLGPYPWKMQIMNIWFNQIGTVGGDSMNDSLKVVIKAGKGLTWTNDSLVFDTLKLYRRIDMTTFADSNTGRFYDSTFSAFTKVTVMDTGIVPIDTLMQGQVLSIATFSGVPGSTAIGLRLQKFHLMAEFKILE